MPDKVITRNTTLSLSQSLKGRLIKRKGVGTTKLIHGTIQSNYNNLAYSSDNNVYKYITRCYCKDNVGNNNLNYLVAKLNYQPQSRQTAYFSSKASLFISQHFSKTFLIPAIKKMTLINCMNRALGTKSKCRPGEITDCFSKYFKSQRRP